MSIEVVMAPDLDRAVTLLLSENDEVTGLFGRVKELFLCPPTALIGLSLEDLVSEADVARIQQLVTTTRSEKRRCRAFVRLQTGGTVPVRVRVDCSLALEESALQVTMVYVGALPDHDPGPYLEAVEESVAAVQHDLVEALGELACAHRGDDLYLALLHIDNAVVDALYRGGGQQRVEQVYHDIENQCAQFARNYQGGQLVRGQFGLVLNDTTKTAALTKRIHELLHTHLSTVETSHLHWQIFALQRGVLTETAVFQAIDYLLSQFLLDNSSTRNFTSLSDVFETMEELSQQALQALRERRDSNTWHLQFSPICDIVDNAPQLQDLSVLFCHNGHAFDLALAPEIAPQAGTIIEADCAAVEAGFSVLADMGMNSLPILLPLDAETVATTSFMDNIERQWRDYEPLAEALYMTLSNFAANAHNPVLQAHADHLLSVGHILGVDDFGAVLVEWDLLEQMGISYVRADPHYTDMLCRNRGDTRLLYKMLKMWNDLGVSVIADGIEDEEQIVTLSRLGIRLGTGGYFTSTLKPSSTSAQTWTAPASALWRDEEDDT